MSTCYIRKEFRDEYDNLFDPDGNQVLLSDSTGSYGVIRNDLGTQVVADATAMTRQSTGVYTYSFTEPAADLIYTAYFEYLIDGTTYWIEDENVPGTPSATGTKRWTRTTLAEHLLAVVPKAARTTAGAVPDELADIVYEAFGDLWECHDWHYAERLGTVSLSDGDSSWSVTSNYADFRKFSQRWLEESGEGPLKFTENASEYEAARYNHSNAAGTLLDGEPELAFIVPDTSLSGYGAKLEIIPESNGTYTYRFWYICTAPSLGLSDTPKWPNFMFRLWHLEAKWRAEQAFCKDDRWKDTYKGARAARDRAFHENDEEMVTSTPEFYDGYGDLDAMASFETTRVSIPVDRG